MTAYYYLVHLPFILFSIFLFLNTKSSRNRSTAIQITLTCHTW